MLLSLKGSKSAPPKLVAATYFFKSNNSPHIFAGNQGNKVALMPIEGKHFSHLFILKSELRLKEKYSVQKK